MIIDAVLEITRILKYLLALHHDGMVKVDGETWRRGEQSILFIQNPPLTMQRPFI